MQDDKILPNNKACITEEEDEEEWSTQSDQEKGQKQLEKSIQKPNNNDSTYTLTKNQRKKRSYIDNVSYLINLLAQSRKKGVLIKVGHFQYL